MKPTTNKFDTQRNAHKLKSFKFRVSSFGFLTTKKPQTKNHKPIKIIKYQCSPCEIAFIKDRTKK